MIKHYRYWDIFVYRQNPTNRETAYGSSQLTVIVTKVSERHFAKYKVHIEAKFWENLQEFGKLANQQNFVPTLVMTIIFLYLYFR